MYILDANIISEPTKTVKNKNIIKKLDETIDECSISSVAWYEILYGIYKMPEGKRKEYVQQYIQNYVFYNYPIILYDDICADIQADFTARLEKIGKPVPYRDAQIAATALANNMTLVTRNTKDFFAITEVTDLRVENWFD